MRIRRSGVVARAAAQRNPYIRRWEVRFGLAVVLAVLVAAALPHTVLAGDPVIYRERVAAMMANGLPYVDVPMEHFPGSLVPMLAAWLLGGFLGEGPYTLAFVVLMAGSLWLTSRSLRSFQAADGSRPAVNFLVLVLPLLPLVLFRNDPWVVLLAAGATALTISGAQGTPSLLLGGAILTKAWPISLIPIAWWRGHRRAAVIVGAVTVTLLALVVRSPGFQATQRGGEIHAETVAGGLLGLTRVVRGDNPGVLRALGAQLPVPAGVVALNALPGLAILAIAAPVLRRPFSRSRAPIVAGALTFGAALALPALSAQYLLWFAPFVACAERPTRLRYVVANLLTLILVVTWFEIFEASLAWWGLLVVRNALVVWLGISMAVAARSERPAREIEDPSVA
jgi:hypothetical protein